jgi:hypothetical protein
MKRQTNRQPLLVIIIICGLFNYYGAFAQKTTNIEDKELFRHWVEYSSAEDKLDNVSKNDTIVYIPKNSLLTADLPMGKKYSGIEFSESGTIIYHVWNKCGTGNPPDFYLGTWKRTNVESQIILTTYREQDGTNPTEYILFFLSSDKLILIRKK